jgi:IS5 family transposase
MVLEIYELINMFKDNIEIQNIVSFKYLVRIFSEQCEVLSSETPEDQEEAQKVKVKDPKAVPSNSLQNPSDPDATYSGHKGQGYSVQLMETCSETKLERDEKHVNLITHVAVTGADVHDSHALLHAIADTEKSGFKPEKLTCDTAYGGDSNVQEAKNIGVEVISPSGGSDPEAGKIRLSDFTFNNKGIVENCPLGLVPWCTFITKKAKIICAFDQRICSQCSSQDKCPVVISGSKVELKYTEKDFRLSNRRKYEQTEEFKKKYAMRSGIEATNSSLDRQTGFKHPRYRGIRKIALVATFKALVVNFRRVLSKIQVK